MTALEHDLTELPEPVLPDPPMPERIPMLTAGGPGLAIHLTMHGPLPATSSAEVLAAAERAHLAGRGGAGFPAAVKLKAVAAGRARHPIVVGNGSEGEPASSKDATLLRSAPHLVIDGAQAAAVAVGAREIILYVAASTVTGLTEALAERVRAGRAAGAAPASVRIVAAAEGFVAGQESAVVSALSGGAAVPSGSGRRVTSHGVDGRPTLVQNVETLAQLALLTRIEHDRTTGVIGSGPHAPVAGTMLTTVWAPDGRPRVLEVRPESTLADLLTRTGWAATPPPAVLLGGYHGRWVPARSFGVHLDPAELARVGASFGAGVVIPLAPGCCGLELSASVTGYLAAESAKQCGPCMFGLPHLANLMEQLARRAHPPGLLAAVERAAGLVEGRGACRHPDGTAGMVRSTLQTFGADAQAHAAGYCLAAESTRAA